MSSKVILLGDSNVGKTSILSSLIDDQFKEKYTPTIGACFHKYVCNTKKGNFTMDIWDTAGQERYRSLLSIYYRNAEGVVIIYDMSEVKTLQTVAYWAKQLESNYTEQPCIILVGNKIDLQISELQQMMIDQKVSTLLVTRPKWKHMTCSAKQHLNVKNIFITLAQMIESKKTKKAQTVEKRINNQKLQQKKKRRSEKSCC